MMRRRELLGLLAAGVVLPGTALGFGNSTRFDVAELDLGRGTVARPNAWKRLLYEVESTTSVEIEASEVHRLTLEDHELFEHPFAVLAGDGAFPEPSDAAVEQLARYLSYGGFLFIDETSGLERSPFDDAVRRLLARVFPTRPLARLSDGHSAYRSFFLLRTRVGRVARFDYLEGIQTGNISPVIYSRNDVSGALDRTDLGTPVHPCVPNGERQRREALKLGINLVMYSLTANYKQDQAHQAELMREGRIDWFE